MPSTVRPSEFRALIPLTDDLCEGFINLMRLSLLWYRYHKYKYTELGTFTPEYEAEICAISCPETTT